MELFSFSVSGTPLLLSASETDLFVYPLHNERLGRPVLLCSNYKSDFSGCVYRNAFYYSYINKENTLLLRRLREPALLFRLDSSPNIRYHTPRLLCYNDSLFLFYFEYESGLYRLKVQSPLSDTPFPFPEPVCASFSELPFLSLFTAGHYLYLFLTTETSVLSYRHTPETGFVPLCTEAELHAALCLPWESEKKQLEQALLQAIQLSEQQQRLLTEKEQQHRQTLRTLEHTSLLLERAKSQYNELMQVAEQYRTEARKWYGKFTDRN